MSSRKLLYITPHCTADTHTHVHVHTDTYTYTHTHTRTRTHMYTYIHTHTYTHTQPKLNHPLYTEGAGLANENAMEPKGGQHMLGADGVSPMGSVCAIASPSDRMVRIVFCKPTAMNFTPADVINVAARAIYHAHAPNIVPREPPSTGLNWFCVGSCLVTVSTGLGWTRGKLCIIVCSSV